MMQFIRVRTPQNVTIEYRLASLGDRMLAYMFDVLVIISYFILLSGINYLVNKLFEVELWDSTWITILMIMPWFLYDLLCETLMEGQSFGKKVMKIRVVRTDGEAVTLGNYLLRWLLGMVELRIVGGLIALLSIAIGGKGQRLGDMAAGTTVVYVGDDNMKLAVPAPIDTEEISLRYPQAAQLTDADIALIKEVLHTFHRNGNQTIVKAAANKLLEKFGLDGFVEANAFEFLKRVITEHNQQVK
jgi:uncharacterized RDD family membrane protein YckC